MFDAKKLLNQMFGASEGSNPLDKVGGMLGGKKGLVIGGLAGAGGGALFTHKQRPKNYVRRVYTRPRNY